MYVNVSVSWSCSKPPTPVVSALVDDETTEEDMIVEESKLVIEPRDRPTPTLVPPLPPIRTLGDPWACTWNIDEVSFCEVDNAEKVCGVSPGEKPEPDRSDPHMIQNRGTLIGLWFFLKYIICNRKITSIF